MATVEEKLNARIYNDYDAVLEAVVKDDDMYDILMSEKRGKAFFELGAKHVLTIFTRQPINNMRYSQGATETDKEYIKRLENDIVELQMSNRGWLHCLGEVK